MRNLMRFLSLVGLIAGLYVFAVVLKSSYGQSIGSTTYIELAILMLWNTCCLAAMMWEKVVDRRHEYFRRKAAEAKERRNATIAANLDSMVGGHPDNRR